ncbi:MAG: hypothetical protein AAF587_40660 [Bacteroidota bacterium]
MINEPSTTVPSGNYRDLFAMKLHYNSGASSIVSGTENLYNDNISAMQWQVLGEESDIRAYAFDYDNQNRLKQALYRENSGSGWNTVSASYDLINIGYDKSGNITELLRMGKTGASSFGLMDGLSYTYSGNRLMKVDDSGLKNLFGRCSAV